MNTLKIKRRTIAISLDNEILLRIDSVRDLIPRSRFIEKIIKDSLRSDRWMLNYIAATGVPSVTAEIGDIDQFVDEW